MSLNLCHREVTLCFHFVLSVTLLYVRVCVCVFAHKQEGKTAVECANALGQHDVAALIEVRFAKHALMSCAMDDMRLHVYMMWCMM